MALRRCENGHYYDENKYSVCPSCRIPGLDIETTRAMPGGGADAGKAEGQRNFADAPTRRKDEPRMEREPGVTKAYWTAKLGIDPVVGWLVCVEGADRGRDYRIRSERNHIGRDPSMDICISGDDTIAREKHAVISFNPKKNTFLIAPGDGRGLIYLNEEEVIVPMELKAYDMIEMGQTKLVFVPFCGSNFQWAAQSPPSV